MAVDKDFTYDVISALRDYGKVSSGHLKTLLLGAANVMEINIRAYLDLASRQGVGAGPAGQHESASIPGDEETFNNCAGWQRPAPQLGVTKPSGNRKDWK